MVKYNIRGENIEVTPALRNYVEEKIGKIEKYFDNIAKTEAHVNLKTYSDKTAKVEVTVPLPRIVLRAEETSPDMYGSIDLVADKLERQIRKYKTRVNRKSRKQGHETPQPVDPDLWAPTGFDEGDIDGDDRLSDQIIRTKQLNLKPMSPEEAVLQMDMLGHDFFVFEDAETTSTNIVYRRKDGKFGLIETE